jgi:hypothetical protein
VRSWKHEGDLVGAGARRLSLGGEPIGGRFTVGRTGDHHRHDADHPLARRKGTSEDYFWKDVLSGDKQPLGTVGDLQSWNLFRPLAIDHDAGLIYIIGMVGLSQKLYVLDEKSGALVRQATAAANNYSALTVTRDHRLVAFYYDTVEKMVHPRGR